MNQLTTFRLGLALAGLCTLSAAAARPAAAQVPGTLYFTLSGVTFADGATASGSFTSDFLTSPPVYTSDVTTTKGLTDTLRGSYYGSVAPLGNGNFQFTSSTNSLILIVDQNAVAPMTYSLVPGQVFGTGFSGSAEIVEGSSLRAVTSGDVIVSATPPAAVPEASTTVSFGLLLALGLGGVVVAACKKKAAA